MKKATLYTAAVAVAFLLSCARDEDNKPQEPAATHAELLLDSHFKWGSAPLETQTLLVSTGEDSLSLDYAGMYLTDFVLIQEDNTELPLSGQVILLKTGSEQAFSLGQVPIGTYKGVRFSVGSAALNTKQPIDYESGPLALQDPGMWWTWNSGYIFMRLDGWVDMDGDGVASDDNSPLTLHLGTNNFAMPVSSLETTSFVISADGHNTLHMNVDLRELLNGVDLATERVTHTGNNLPLANKIKTNVPSVFSAE